MEHRVSLETKTGVPLVHEVDEQVCENLSVLLKLDGSDVRTMVTALYTNRKSLDTEFFRFKFHTGDEMPAWVEKTFMVNPALWSHAYCALVRKVPGVEFMDREMGYLVAAKPMDDGKPQYEFMRGCVWAGVTADTLRELLTAEQVQGLYADDWRVD